MMMRSQFFFIERKKKKMKKKKKKKKKKKEVGDGDRSGQVGGRRGEEGWRAVTSRCP